jgi:hypothetical protein
MTDWGWDGIGKYIVTTSPALLPPAVEPFSWDKMMVTYDLIRQKWYDRDRYVVSDSLWHRLMESASPDSRRELEFLRESGTIIVSSVLLHDDRIWRIKGDS